MGTRWYVEPPGAAAPISSSFPLPQTEGENDQSQANHHREGTDERRQERHICTGQGCKDYAKEHRQGAASGQQPPILHLGTQQYGGEYSQRTGHHRPPDDDVDQAVYGQPGPEEGYQPGDDSHRPFCQREPPSRALVRRSESGQEGDRPVNHRVEAEQEGEHGEDEAWPEEDHDSEKQGDEAPQCQGSPVGGKRTQPLPVASFVAHVYVLLGFDSWGIHALLSGTGREIAALSSAPNSTTEAQR